ncbi:hypothetical protein CR513_32685, partial [Mucuna pruriens]
MDLIEETNEVIITQILHGINTKIQNLVELHSYSIWRKKSERKKRPRKGSEKKQAMEKSFRNKPSTYTKFSSIKCFKCLFISFQPLNKITIVIRENKEVESESYEEDNTSYSEGESSGDLTTHEGDLIMYKDVILYDVVSMEAIHLFLGRP